MVLGQKQFSDSEFHDPIEKVAVVKKIDSESLELYDQYLLKFDSERYGILLQEKSNTKKFKKGKKYTFNLCDVLEFKKLYYPDEEDIAAGHSSEIDTVVWRNSMMLFSSLYDEERTYYLDFKNSAEVPVYTLCSRK